MSLNIDAKSEKHWEVTFEGDDRAIANMIIEKLNADKDVEFAASVVDHPVISQSPRIVVKTKEKGAKAAISRAITKVLEDVSDLKAKLKRIREK